MSKTVYISGRIRGLEERYVHLRFALAEQRLRSAGYEVINPLKIGDNSHFTWADYVLRDLLYLRKADAIYLLDNWRESAGARTEAAFADGLGIEVLYEKEGE